ncbi:GCN5-related N-acetyltransferase [Bradyrhizobium sp. STM 3843]|nr:GCN5-related N-acetyltransferase [Bradyrhizobium sp. STM 3843]
MPVVRFMAAADVAVTARLFQEMQAHYRVDCPSLSEITARLTGLPNGVSILVAANPDVVGFAALSAIFPGPGLNPGFFLKELFVSAHARRCGVGTALIRYAAQLAVQRGFTRLDWTADRTDDKLLRFYMALGAVEQPEKVFLRLSGPALNAAASHESGEGEGMAQM